MAKEPEKGPEGQIVNDNLPDYLVDILPALQRLDALLAGAV